MTMNDVFDQARHLTPEMQHEMRMWRDRAKASPGVVFTMLTNRLAMTMQYLKIAKGATWSMRMRLYGESLTEGYDWRIIDPETEKQIAAIGATLMIPLEENDRGGVFLSPDHVELKVYDGGETVEFNWPDDEARKNG